MGCRIRPRPFLIELEFFGISHLLTRKYDVGGHETPLCFGPDRGRTRPPPVK